MSDDLLEVARATAAYYRDKGAVRTADIFFQLIERVEEAEERVDAFAKGVNFFDPEPE